MQVELRPRSMSEQFGLTFSLASAHFVRLFLITFATSLPLTLIQHYADTQRTQASSGNLRVDAPSTTTLQNVAPLRIPGLLEYQANWRHRLEERPA